MAAAASASWCLCQMSTSNTHYFFLWHSPWSHLQQHTHCTMYVGAFFPFVAAGKMALNEHGKKRLNHIH